MTRKLVAHDHRRDPISGMVQWPLGNSGKTHRRLSQHSTEQGISANQNLSINNMKAKVHAYKGDLLVQPKHTSPNKNPRNEASKFDERYDPIIEANDIWTNHRDSGYTDEIRNIGGNIQEARNRFDWSTLTIQSGNAFT
jgi:hypothetical protein